MIDRKELDTIIKNNGGNNWWKPDLFKEYTLKLLPKELEVIENPPESANNYNCFIHALGLSDNQEIITDSGGFIQDTFIFKLIDEKLLEYTDNPVTGDYIIYRDLINYPKYITHIGVLLDDQTVISKWAWGPTVKHSMFNVPFSYGSDIKYIKKISKEDALALYTKYKEFNVQQD